MMVSRISICSLIFNIFCVGFLVRVTDARSLSENNVCAAYNMDASRCIAFSDCESIQKVLRNPMADLERVEQILSSPCEKNGSEVKICCPTEPITRSGDYSPDIRDHKNLHLLPKDCGHSDANQDRIINGENARLNEFPWMALLRYTENHFRCGGTIINRNYILTAGHCVYGERKEKLVSVRVGEYSIENRIDCEIMQGIRKCNPKVQELSIERIILHSEYVVKTDQNDIALIRVSTMKLNHENVKPVCLPVRTLDSPFKYAIVTGWGFKVLGSNKGSDILQKANLPIMDLHQCRKTWNDLTNKQICAGGSENKFICRGDSGGPLMVARRYKEQREEYAQEGILSYGPSQCIIETQQPGVYTRTRDYMVWILDNMRP